MPPLTALMSRVAATTGQDSGLSSRRVTRSRSRELDAPSYASTGQGPSASAEEKAKGKATAQLSMIAEESPGSSMRTPNSRHGTSIVPESPEVQEGHTNISGTTILPPDSDLEDGEPDPALMADELSDLQRHAAGIMDLLLSHSSDTIGIVKEAKRLNDPKHVRYKRLKHSVSKFKNSMKVFSNHSYIDVTQVCRLIPPVSIDGAERPWSPSPILYKANCARLALDVLPTAFGAQSPMQAIRSLEGRFPAQFMNSVVDRTSSRAVGASWTGRATFEQALEIRTQFFIAELERRQSDKDFDPRAILKGVFCDDLALDGDDSQVPISLRGFNLAPAYEDENGCLPDQFQDAVTDRMSEIEYDLFDENGASNIKGLKAAYPWSRFVLRTARWMLTRDGEIRDDMQRQHDLNDLRDALDQEIQRRIDGTSTETPARNSASVVPHTDKPRPRESLSHEIRAASLIRAAQTGRRENVASPETRRSLENSVTFVEPAPPAVEQRSPVSQGKQPARGTGDQMRRKSLKNQYLNRDSLDALRRRKTARSHQDLTNLESQPPARPSSPRRSLFEYPSFEQSVTAGQAEIPQSPDMANDGPDDFTLQHNDEELSFNRGRASGVVESTSPPGSSRINHTSHNPSPSRLLEDDFYRVLSQQPARTAFIDHQTNAERVSPISQTASAERRRDVMDLMGSGKRAREDSDSDNDNDEPDDEDDFDRDDRRIDIAERRAQKPEQRPAPKRTRLGSDSAQQLQEALDDSQPAARTGAQVPSLHETTVAAPSRLPARDEPTAALPAGLTPSSSGYKHWSQEEVDRLKLLMRTYGTHWADIRRADEVWPESQGGPKFTRNKRTQVNLKDKARNLLAEYLTAGQTPPPGFEKVKPPSRFTR